MTYLLSIIIPTKDRYCYLKGCIKSITLLDSPEMEIIIQDNTNNNDEIVSYLEEINWPHIKYFHETRPLSQTENSDLALSKATGKYVCYIGDDDTITTQMIQIVKWLEVNKIESCGFPTASYYWSDVVFKFYQYPTLSFTQKRARIQSIDARDELTKCLLAGATRLYKMPKVYHGIVSKEALDALYSRVGSYFPGPSPDMANATSLSLTIRTHVWIEIPLMVSGTSYKSAGGMGARGAHKAKIKDVAQLSNDTEGNWEKTIPRIWLGETIWCESCVKALRTFGKEDLIKLINWNYLYAKMLVFHPEYYLDVKPYINGIAQKIKTMSWVLILVSNRSYYFVKNFFSTKLKITNKKAYYDINTLEEAMLIVNEYNQKKDVLRILK